MAAGYRKCPECGQDVLKTANECKQCGYSLAGQGARRTGVETEEKKYAKIEVYVQGLKMVGSIILGGSGFDFRLSDFLNTKAQRFFPLLDAEVQTLAGVKINRHDVIMVNKESVKLLIPLEEPERDKRIEGIVSASTYRW